MSSEDTEDENTLAVRPLPWISQKAEKLKFTLDNEKAKRMSSQSKRQAKKKSRAENLQGLSQAEEVHGFTKHLQVLAAVPKHSEHY